MKCIFTYLWYNEVIFTRHWVDQLLKKTQIQSSQESGEDKLAASVPADCRPSLCAWWAAAAVGPRCRARPRSAAGWPATPAPACRGSCAEGRAFMYKYVQAPSMFCGWASHICLHILIMYGTHHHHDFISFIYFTFHYKFIYLILCTIISKICFVKCD